MSSENWDVDLFGVEETLFLCLINYFKSLRSFDLYSREKQAKRVLSTMSKLFQNTVERGLVPFIIIFR